MTHKYQSRKIPDFIPNWFLPQAVGLSETEVYPEISCIVKKYEELLFADNLDVRNAWIAIGKRVSKLEKSDSEQDERRLDYFKAVFFTIICFDAIGPKNLDMLRPSDRERLAQNIVSAERVFSSLLAETGLDWPIAAYAKLMDRDPWRQTMTLSEEKNEIPPHYFEPVSQLLSEISKYAVEALNPSAAVVKRPGGADAKKLHFCRVVTDFFRQTLDGPLYAATAAFATVLIGEVVDAEYARFAAKGDRGD